MSLARRAQPKPVRERDTPHLVFVRTLPCLLCAAEGHHTPAPSQAMHVSFLAEGGKGYGSKAPDRFTVPGCDDHHREQTNAGLRQVHERTFWARSGVAVRAFCNELHAVSGDLAAGLALIASYAARARSLPAIRPAGELLEPVALTRPVLLEAQASDERDADGNVVVHLPVLGPRGTAPARVAVDPNSIQESGR